MACLQPASANAVALYYCVQDDCGVLPDNPVFTKFRFTGGVPTMSVDTLNSSELDGTAERTDVRIGNRQVAAAVSCELIYGAHDELLESAMQSTWQAGLTIPAQSVTIDATARTATITGYDATADMKVGDYIRFPDMTLAGNAEPLLVTTLSFSTDTVIGLDAAKVDNPTQNINGIVDETVSTTITTSDKLTIGTERKRLAILTEYGDINGGPTYDLTLDNECTSFDFNVAVNDFVTGTLNFIGVSYSENVGLPAGATLQDNNANKVYTGVDGSLVKNGIPLLLSTGATITLDRGATAAYQLGSKFASHISYDKADVTVSVDTFFYDYNLSQDFENEVEGDYTINCNNNNQLVGFSFPNSLITGVNRDVTTGDVTQTVDLVAYKPPGEISSLIIQRVS